MLPKLLVQDSKTSELSTHQILKITQIFELTKLSMKQGLTVAKPFAFKLVEAFKSNQHQ
jgi:hypothetical protein